MGGHAPQEQVEFRGAELPFFCYNLDAFFLHMFRIKNCLQNLFFFGQFFFAQNHLIRMHKKNHQNRIKINYDTNYARPP